MGNTVVEVENEVNTTVGKQEYIGKTAKCQKGASAVITGIKVSKDGRPLYVGRAIGTNKPWQSLKPVIVQEIQTVG